jgi:hypothetical protein
MARAPAPEHPRVGYTLTGVNCGASAGVPGGMTVSTDHTNAVNGAARPENAKPVTIQLRDDVLQRLKIVAILQDTSVGELLADAAAALVKRDLKKLLGKLEP